MKYSGDIAGKEQDIVGLFKTSFTASEGVEEGQLIERLVIQQLADTATDDIFVVIAEDDDALAAAAVFTRLRFPEDGRTVFVLGPAAVLPAKQRQGVGQALLRYGLDVLRAAGVDVAITYGDPSYYQQVGFQPISEASIAAPFKLQCPEGWLGQSLNDMPLTSLRGPSSCVEAFNDPVFW